MMDEIKKRFFTSFFLLLIIFLSITNMQILFVLIFVINFLTLNEFLNILKKIFTKNSFNQFFSILFALFYLIFFSLIIFFFLADSYDLNIIKLLFILSICISTDIGGFMFGKIVRGKKLTKISPNKTYSGLFGSLFLSIITGICFVLFIKEVLFFDTFLIIYIILVSTLSQIGDLFISFLKRSAKIKDTGKLLPGHGGILDRIDGILLALPFGIILF